MWYSNIRKVSKKKAAKYRARKKMYEKLETFGYCSGCGRSDVILTNSHLLSQYHYSKYMDKAWNIKQHCVTCNTNWQNPLKRPAFLDYAESMEIIKEHDEAASLELIGKEELNTIKFNISHG